MEFYGILWAALSVATIYKTSVNSRMYKKDKKLYEILLRSFNPLSANSHKMVKHTQTIRRQIAGELFECVWLFCGIGH